MSYLEELLPEFRKGVKIRRNDWDVDRYLYYENGAIYNEYNSHYQLSGFDINSYCWELYKAPERIDWQYIIAHKCLCWFWDANYCKMCNILQKIDTSTAGTKIYIDENNLRWNNCRPVRKDEVNFYENKKND